MHGAPGTPGAPGARRAAPAPRWVRAATEWMPQRLRAEPAGRSRDAGCVRMRRVKASYPQHIGRRAPKGADAPGRVAPVPLGYWEMQHYAQLCAALGRRRTRADAQMAQKASGRAGCERTRIPKPPRSVVTRIEIGRNPRRDRSGSASRSVATWGEDALDRLVASTARDSGTRDDGVPGLLRCSGVGASYRLTADSRRHQMADLLEVAGAAPVAGFAVLAHLAEVDPATPLYAQLLGGCAQEYRAHRIACQVAHVPGR